MVTVRATGLGKTYRGGPALEGASFALEAGTLTVLAGPNGAGKTTLLKRMVEMIRGTGETTFEGRRWSELTVPRREVGVYLGTGCFHSGVTAEEHLRLVGLAAQVSAAAIEEAVERFGLGPHRSQRVARLSLGLRQRLGIAAATLADPAVLLLDEPFSALDPQEAVEVYAWLTDQVARGRTILVSTHHLTRIEPCASHLMFMDQGRVVASGAVAAVAESFGVPPSMTLACSTPAQLAAELARAGVAASIRSGDTITLDATQAEGVEAVVSGSQVVVHARWIDRPGLTSLYEKILQ